ncbi:MAG: Deoxyguanosinetriphosphate triphosphohydrolase-like protein [Alphaproteobacteria bacterium MarineAlpha5_Bin8]|nr:MAG: Deoxyguanosinetriphosphate triphosphohydrolase-like protein [Alphaproteobacteria bacterium MarineAlpha5_Bin7]PPR45488.1 MAG: Deoxyguanosinetriphosphate triphosphohydrolase-like protein [Alphaproteobacteria bacterium MarineAlpha5_Bin8]PPR53445.1 MAG: Deoxyguanosinetriphosphate triphosphohydrolase-like protein [Alphaproteobacteria bacterium MarineAlpha5_Bin6]|tara:strand:+ start:3025 stop:4152 length:1128 start_codon:yes stop_codon:yes gene_type:complete
MDNVLSANPSKTKGRLYEEFKEETSRTAFERDRDRIIHSNSFRKLKHKTQVFIESDSDYYRTRLTHSLEVAQIARSLSRAMNLNEDLAEVVSLAHDLGHPPFGHNGEKSLNDSMQNFGGFNHNDQTMRVITHIEKRYPNFSGLNLSWESLEGIVKHNGIFKKKIPFHINNYNKIHKLDLHNNPHLESQIAAISDDIAYNNHDVEDALRAKLISLNSLREIKYFNEIIKEINDRYKNLDDSLITYQMLRISISKMVNDIIIFSKKNILLNNIKEINDVFNYKNFLITMSKEMNDDCLMIRDFLDINVYNHPKLSSKRNEVKNIVSKLFKYFLDNSKKLPPDWLKEEKNENINRIVCDYISGMTDRYASKLYKSIYE